MDKSAAFLASPMELAAPFVVASDLHLRSMHDERTELLLDVLRRLGPKVEVFVLNGDIFDFCFGDSAYFRQKFAPLGRALAAVAERGIRVLLVEGNHDFHLQDLGWDGVEIVSSGEYVLQLSSGERLKIGHGDLIKKDPAYELFRRFVRSRLVKWWAKRIPGRWLDAYALKHAQISRSRDVYRTLDHHKLMEHANAWLEDGVYDHGIFGHFHVPYAETRASGKGYILSVDCWDRPNLLLYIENDFFRAFLTKPHQPFALQRVQSYLAR